MKQKWQKLGSREGVDLTTIAIIARAFYDEIWNYRGAKQELFFTVLENKVFAHYIAELMFKNLVIGSLKNI